MRGSTLAAYGGSPAHDARIRCSSGELPQLVGRRHDEEFASRRDAEHARAVKGPVELLIIEDGNHIANNRGYRWRPFGGDWMAAQLTAG